MVVADTSVARSSPWLPGGHRPQRQMAATIARFARLKSAANRTAAILPSVPRPHLTARCFARASTSACACKTKNLLSCRGTTKVRRWCNHQHNTDAVRWPSRRCRYRYIAVTHHDRAPSPSSRPPAKAATANTRASAGGPPVFQRPGRASAGGDVNPVRPTPNPVRHPHLTGVGGVQCCTARMSVSLRLGDYTTSHDNGWNAHGLLQRNTTRTTPCALTRGGLPSLWLPASRLYLSTTRTCHKLGVEQSP